ncbi:MAG: hypothetical protein WC306_01550 [Candidatus Paceibacterota bacterium]
MVLIFAVLFFVFFLEGFTLTPESNAALEVLKEKHREKEIVLEKEKGIVWSVILPKNDGVKTSEIKEAVYDDEGKFEAVYTFTEIIIVNPKGWTSVTWGVASKFYPYDVPRIRFIFTSFNHFFSEENTWISDDGTLTVTEGPMQEWWGTTIIWSNVILVSQDETIFFTIPSVIITAIEENKGTERTLFLFIFLNIANITI